MNFKFIDKARLKLNGQEKIFQTKTNLKRGISEWLYYYWINGTSQKRILLVIKKVISLWESGQLIQILDSRGHNSFKHVCS